MPSRSDIGPDSESELARIIQFARGRRVILDYILAAVYGVTTKRLNEQVARNLTRFPEDFMFRLTPEESAAFMRSHIATASQGRRNLRFAPFAFTEHGAIMAATVLSSPRAIEMSVYIVRAFVRLREILKSNQTLARKLVQLETRLDKKFVVHDKAIDAILAAIRQLMAPVPLRKRGIGFTADIEPPK
jgi:hypothetical protein